MKSTVHHPQSTVQNCLKRFWSAAAKRSDDAAFERSPILQTPSSFPNPKRRRRFALPAHSIRVLALAASLFLALGAAANGRPQTLSDETLGQIRFEQKLNSQVSLALPFRDEAGREVRLGQYFGRKPVLLVLGYYECPMLCTLVLNGMVASAADLEWSIGREFEVINVSINPNESPALAAAKKRNYLKSYGRPSSAQGWHFLTGSQESLQQLAREVGFRYAYDPASKQYAHPSGLIILTPQGKVSRYLFGVTYPPKELYAALRDASASKVGSPIQQLILLCFHYNPINGKYSGTIIIILRLMAVATMLGLLGLIAYLVRRGRAAQAILAPAANRTSPALEETNANPSSAAPATAPPPSSPLRSKATAADGRITHHASGS